MTVAVRVATRPAVRLHWMHIRELAPGHDTADFTMTRKSPLEIHPLTPARPIVRKALRATRG